MTSPGDEEPAVNGEIDHHGAAVASPSPVVLTVRLMFESAPAGTVKPR